MKKSFVFLATGFEEIEALATVDVLRRAGIEVTVVSIYKDRMVTGAHGITVAADVVMAGADFSDCDWLICPGGMPGSEHLAKFEPLTELLKQHNANGGRIAAICAAPAVVLAPLGILDGKRPHATLALKTLSHKVAQRPPTTAWSLTATLSPETAPPRPYRLPSPSLRKPSGAPRPMTSRTACSANPSIHDAPPAITVDGASSLNTLLLRVCFYPPYDFFRWAVGNYASARQQEAARTQLPGHVEVVGGDEACVGKSLQNVDKGASSRQVEIRGGFVHHQYARLHRQY